MAEIWDFEKNYFKMRPENDLGGACKNDGNQ